MQDKKRIKSENLVDSGWGHMEAILNKEMPTKKDKRRYWFLLFFLIPIGLGSMYYYHYQVDKEEIRHTSPLVEMGTQEMPVSNDLTNQETKNENLKLGQHVSGKNENIERSENKLTNANSNVAQERSTTSMKTNNSKKIETNNIRESEIASANELLSENEEIVVSNNKANNVEDVVEDSNIDDKNLNELKLNENMLLEERVESLPRNQRMAMMSNLVLLKGKLMYSSLANLPFIIANEGNSIVVSDEKKGPHFGLYVGLLSQNSFLSNGYQVGMSANIGLTSKLDLSISAGFTHLINKENSASFSLDDLEADPGAMMDSQLVLSSATAYGILKSRNYIGLTVKPEYWINKKMSLSAGPSLSVLLSATNRELFSNNVFLEGKFLTEENLLKKVDFALNFEYKYHVSRRLAFSLSYNLGLTSLWDGDLNTERGAAEINNPANSTLVYQNTSSNYNRYFGLRAYFKF